MKISQHSTKAESANLDCLRAIAVLLVVVDHFVATLAGRYSPVCEFGEALGRLGVIAFFVHTSLVLMLSQERLLTPV